MASYDLLCFQGCGTTVQPAFDLHHASIHHRRYACLFVATHRSFEPRELSTPAHQSDALRHITFTCTNCVQLLFATHMIYTDTWSVQQFHDAAAELSLSPPEVSDLRQAIRAKCRWVSFATQPSPYSSIVPSRTTSQLSLPSHDGSFASLPDLTNAASMVTDDEMLSIGERRILSPQSMPSPFDFTSHAPAIPLSPGPAAASSDAPSPRTRSPDSSHILIFRSTAGWFPVTITHEPDLVYREAFSLLQDNSWLPQCLGCPIEKEGAIGAKATLNEDLLLYLHLLYQLHFQQVSGALVSNLLISFLHVEHAVVPFTSLRLDPAIPPSRAALLDDGKNLHVAAEWHEVSFVLAEQRARAAPPWKSQQAFPVNPLSSTMRVRFCDHFGQLFDGPPLRMLYCPNIMDFNQIATHDDIVSTIPLLLRYLAGLGGDPRPALLYPPMEREEMTEHKAQTYKRFSDVMLKTTWIDLEADDDLSITKLAGALLGACTGDGQYVVKGDYSCAAKAVSFIEVKDGACQELRQVVQTLVRTKHQRILGLQPFVACFKSNEIRHFCIPYSPRPGVAPRWVISFCVRTQYDDQSSVTIESCAFLHEDTLATKQLVEDLLRDDRHFDFFHRLIIAGVPMLRIDCLYDFDAKRAYLNEFAQAPDAMIWTQVHSQDAIHYVPMIMAKQMADMLRADALLVD